MKRLAVVVGFALVAGSLVAVPLAQQKGKPKFSTWHQYLGGSDSSQYSSLDQINKKNVGQLQIAWTYATGDTRTYRFNPIVIDNVMYTLAKNMSIVALDAATGKEIWTHENQPAQIGDRGINYWESADKSDRRLLYVNGGFLTAIDAATGKTIETFGEKGRVDLRVGLNRDVSGVRPLQTGNPGRIYENVIIMSLPAGGANYISNPGDTHAYDVRTGKLLWTFHSVPEKGEVGAETWPEAALATGGGVHNWSELTIDETRGIAYVPFGTARFDFYGGNRIGDDLFGNSIVALDAKTGTRLWHFQAVHHDLWDYDFPQSPKLLTIRHDGRNVDVIAQASKQGYLYVLDRVTGKPIWPIEEKPVPQTDVPGEKTSPTQPIPTAPPPFARQSFTEKDVNPYLTADEQASVRELLKNSRNEGVFTPPSVKGSIELPGHNGGANWGSSAVNPTKGTFYIVSKELPTFLRIVPPGAPTGRGGRGGARANAPAPGGPEGAARGVPPASGPEAAPGRGPAAPTTAPGAPEGFVAYNSPYDFFNNYANGMSAMGPPWSQLTAYDLNTGKIIWQVPNGEMPGLPGGKTEQGSYAPRGGPVATAGGLIFLGTSSDRKVRAYDQDTGKVLWSMDVGAAVEGVPTVYEIGGREYVVFCVGGGRGLFAPRGVGIAADPAPAQYVALALPKK
ncbi:MAG TPA: pyrroloquinoline quinone-dependent dehydrogenase [Vicinamibacterales bacterium]|nr:pyrroloquinoline quinone-dependent dehydrogenase [Vicinamibacterales bacterium]